jgi:hypothetical protein
VNESPTNEQLRNYGYIGDTVEIAREIQEARDKVARVEAVLARYADQPIGRMIAQEINGR